MRIVLDSCIIYSGLRSQGGASFRILASIPAVRYQPAVTVPLALQYEDVLSRSDFISYLSKEDINYFLDGLIANSVRIRVPFLWRPYLSDPGDDMVLEAAVAADAQRIVTYDLRHFAGIEKFGLRAIRPNDFLKEYLR